MGSAKFYLKDSKSSQPTPIYLVAFINNRRFKWSTGRLIKVEDWSTSRQRPKPSHDNYDELKTFLEVVSKGFDDGVLRHISTGNGVDFTELRTELDKFSTRKEAARKPEPTPEPKELTFFEVFDQFLTVKKHSLSVNYLKTTTTAKNHLLKYQELKGQAITFDSVDLVFYEQFVAYLYEQGLSLNSVGTNINRLKYFLQWAAKNKFHSNYSFRERDFRAMEKDTDQIALSEDEVLQLLNLDLSDNARLRHVRDTFCFGCFTGLRFSDISRVRREYLKGDQIHMISTKTKERLRIPLNDYAMEILIRNNFELPAISNQKTNDYLKELGELAGLNTPETITSFHGAKSIEVTHPKYNLLTTHTARRSFITISLSKGMRAEVVMSITGHKSYKNFQKYIKITSKDKEREMRRVWSRPTETKLAVV